MSGDMQGNGDSLTLKVSKEAGDALKSALKDQKDGTVIRVFVQLGGGCGGDCGESSPQFGMALDTLKGGDKVLLVDGVQLVADEYSSGFLDGADIEYVRTGSDGGFRISSPHIPAPSGDSCGCGGSCGSG